jgi:hypothetical protein
VSAVAAAAAAASAAQQAAQQARQRRAAAEAEQKAKQGMPGGSGPVSSVAEGVLGGVNQGLNVMQNPRIQDLWAKDSKKVALDTASKPLGQPMNPAAQGPTMQDMMPEYLKYQQMGFGGYGGGMS